MRAGAVAELMEGETNPTVPVTFKDMIIRTHMIRVIEERKKKQSYNLFTFLPLLNAVFSLPFHFERKIHFDFSNAIYPLP